jgi:hypothetical protein
VLTIGRLLAGPLLAAGVRGHLALMAAMCTVLDSAERTGEHLEQPEAPTAVVDGYGLTDLVTSPGPTISAGPRRYRHRRRACGVRRGGALSLRRIRWQP